MAYIDETYYTGTFKGTAIASSEFDKLADIASDLVDSIVLIDVDTDDMSEAQIGYLKKATAYETELLYLQGGIDAITGMAADNFSSAQVGGISVAKADQAMKSFPTVNGLPISALTVWNLKKAGLMRRLVAEDVEDDDA